MKLLIVGDSFAADWSVSDHSYQGWPQLLKKTFDIDNLAQAGCGQYRILQQLKSCSDLDQYSWIIICHTTPTRVHTKQHPVHCVGSLHQNCDLIFSDIEFHTNRQKKPSAALISARDFFIYHYDETHQNDMYRLIINEIDRIVHGRSVIVVDNFAQLDKKNYKNYLNFNDITTVIPGHINHCSRQGNIDICQRILDIVLPTFDCLPNMQVPSMRLANLQYLSPDDPNDTKLNTNYSYQIDYSFNSRGFRDHEWPQRGLQDAIWCVGDSATLGIGSPYSHSWPVQLEKKSQKRTMKIAMAGASNDWIARQAENILQNIQPKTLVIHWSYLHRNEFSCQEILQKRWEIFYNNVRDPSWPPCAYQDHKQLPQSILEEIQNHHIFDHVVTDEQRRNPSPHPRPAQDDAEHTIALIKHLESIKGASMIIHSVIPGFAISAEANEIFCEQIQQLSINFVPEFDVVDWARDQIHYDVRTSQQFVSKICELI